MIHIAPSILAADFSRLGEEVLATERGGAQRIHLDVMDGHFVPNLSMGPVVVKSLRRVTRLPFEIHLMVEEPAKFIESFTKAGANAFIAHVEVLADPRPLIDQVHGLGCRIGLALRPDTPIAAIEPLLKDIDLALCMTVHPGFAGQKFLPQSPERIGTLRRLIDEKNPNCELEVDGGIDLRTAPQCIAAGANVLVAATAIFAAPDGPEAAVRKLRALAP